MPRRLAALAFTVLPLFASSPALALTQPGQNVDIPVNGPLGDNPPRGLQNLFDARGENINAIAQASTTPETFVPTCQLTFTVLQRWAGYKNSFGWYNVTGQKPTLGELHEFLSCNDAVGTVKVLDIKNDPGYLGGEIGFYEATGSCGQVVPGGYDNLFYSELKYNPLLNNQPYIHLLIYQSTATPNAFYFGWEDLLGGGDNDFDDLTTFVEGIYCTGGGDPCATGQPGICGDGILQCQSGQLTCVPTSQPVPEKCDGLDNDCNGAPDDGTICPEGEVCDKGTCVPKCNGGEFTCPDDKVCAQNGVCVDPTCLDVSCPEGQKCITGQCVGPCDDVVCPYGQVCRVGVCVDPCVGITCDANQVCVKGVCTQKCQCAGCGADESCQPDGRCQPNACLNAMCPAGFYCAPDGSCKDACEGASCPAGEQCAQGMCVPAPESGTGGSGQGGGIFAGAGGSGGAASGTGGAGGAGTTSSGEGGSVNPTKSDSSCGCRVPGGSEEGWGAAALAALGIAVASRRPRRRGPQA